MLTLTVSLPETMKDWIETQVEDGGFATASDYLEELVLRDRAEQVRDSQLRAREPQLDPQEHEARLNEIRRIVDEADASGVSERSFEDIFAEAQQIARDRGKWRE